jgi:hypothetical protein
LQKRLDEAQQTRLNVRREEALQCVLEAGRRGNWQASAWFLERVWPGEFALRSVSRPDLEQDEAQPEIPSEVSQRHRRLMLEQAKEDEQKQVLTG